MGATCHLCQGDFFQWQIKCVRDGRNRDGGELAARADCNSLLLSCEGTLRRNCTSSCMCKCENIEQLIYFLFRQHASAVSTHILTQKMKDMQPSPCLLCVVVIFVALELFCFS